MHKFKILKLETGKNKLDTVIRESSISFDYDIKGLKAQVEKITELIKDTEIRVKDAHRVIERTETQKETELAQMSIDQLENKYIEYIKARKTIFVLTPQIERLRKELDSLKPAIDFIKTELNIKL